MNKYGRTLTILFALLLLSLTPTIGVAAEPTPDVDHRINTTGWSWKLVNNGYTTITLSDNRQASSQYDISECLFCSGEGDNCQEDGIFVIEMPDNEPVIAVICHKGAHSQRLQVLAPLRDPEKAVFMVTGAYWVDYEPLLYGLQVKYDRYGDDGEIATHEAKWPQ